MKSSVIERVTGQTVAEALSAGDKGAVLESAVLVTLQAVKTTLINSKKTKA